MRAFLFVVCLVVAVSAHDDEFNMQLLRALADFGRSFHGINTQHTNGGNASISTQNSSDVNSTEDSIPPMTLKEFQHTLSGWEKVSEIFIEKVRNVKPLAFQALAGHKDWKEVEAHTEDISKFGSLLYHKILVEALIASHRLFQNDGGFGRAGRCRQMHALVDGFDAKDKLAELRSTEALVSDLDCLSGEVKDTIRDLHVLCSDSDHFGVYDALGMIGRVMQALYRFREDGSAFDDAAIKIKRKFDEAYPPKASGQVSASRNVSALLKRLLSNLRKN